MKPPLRHAVLAIALSLSAPIVAQSPPTDAQVVGLDVRYLRLSDLPAILTATGGDPAAWRTPAALKGTALSQSGASADPVIAWVPASALASPHARAEALDIVSSGVALLVTARTGERRYEIALFGVEATEATVLYQPLRHGGVHLHLFEDTVDPLALAAIAGHVVEDARRLAMADAEEEASRSRLAPVTRGPAQASQTAPARETPVRPWAASKTHTNGSRVALIATVTRDTSRTHDSKLITVKSTAEVIPHQRGLDTRKNNPLWWVPIWPFPSLPHGAGIYVPGEYGLSTWLMWPEDATPNARLLSYHPMTDGRTARTITDKHVTTSTWGVSVSPETTRGLADGKISSAGKFPASFSYSETNTDEQSVTITLDDYSAAFSEFQAENQTEASWRFALADDISAKPAYFGKPATTGGRSRMMKHAGLETAATWRVDGTYEGPIKVTSAATVMNRYFHHQAKTTADAIDCHEKVVVLDATPCELSIVTSRGPSDRREFVATAQPIASVIMDLGTPYLTRTPTVLLQSLGDANRCITQPDASARITLETCDRTEGHRVQQWMMDEAGRYVNRGSGMCLETDTAFGGVRATACTQTLAQQWEWRADRIHSRFEGGRLRLHTDASGLSTAFRPGKDALLPVNATNALLPPWTTYPLQPRRGDYIPGFNFQAEPIPDAYLAFGDVDSGQRWPAIPLIFGIK